MQGYQCHKAFYYSLHKKNLIPPITPELQSLFDQGNLVTEAARKKFSNGVLVDLPAYDFVGSLKKTKELLANHTPVIFEAAFEYKGCYARADILIYNPLSQRWSVIEVKSTARVKPEHLDDVGLQVWIMANAGLPIEKISVMHLNNSCQYPDLTNLFCEEDVTERLREGYPRISPKLNQIFKSAKEDQEPAITWGEHCYHPRECQFIATCREAANLPEPNVFQIPNFYKQRWEFFRKGQVALHQISPDQIDQEHKRYFDAHQKGVRFINVEGVKSALIGWKFPLIFLDFETINPAIPRYDGTSPFQQVPFQLSVHKLLTIDSEPEHFEYLHEDQSDPRPAVLKALNDFCGGEGSVVAYYSKFESGCLADLAEYSPSHKVNLDSIKSRLVDPLPIFKENIYDAKFEDSFSIKSVGPAILGDKFSYDQMVVGDGGMAQRAFEEIISSGTDKDRKNLLINSLKAYCAQDTLVMVELVKWLYTLK
jgi:hypothetical protein